MLFSRFYIVNQVNQVIINQVYQVTSQDAVVWFTEFMLTPKCEKNDDNLVNKNDDYAKYVA